MRERPSEVTLNIILSAAVLVFAVLLVRRELFVSRVAPPGQPSGPPTFVADWESVLSRSPSIGSRTGRIQLIEFVDYECGFCRLFEETRARLDQRFPGEIRVAVVHFPIRGHRFARMAASAAECGHQSGVFKQIHESLFRYQDSVGLKSWSSFARDAGIADTVAFDACMKSETIKLRIDADLALGRALSVVGTPTLIVNGWKYLLPPSEEELAGIARSLVSGENWRPATGRDTISIPALRMTATLPR